MIFSGLPVPKHRAAEIGLLRFRAGRKLLHIPDQVRDRLFGIMRYDGCFTRTLVAIGPVSPMSST